MRAQQHGTAAAGRRRDRTQPEERRGYARHIRGPGRFKARDDSYQVCSTRTMDTKTGQRKYPLACECMVGVRRFELLTSSVSGKRSPPELNARISAAGVAARSILRENARVTQPSIESFSRITIISSPARPHHLRRISLFLKKLSLATGQTSGEFQKKRYSPDEKHPHILALTLVVKLSHMLMGNTLQGRPGTTVCPPNKLHLGRAH